MNRRSFITKLTAGAGAAVVAAGCKPAEAPLLDTAQVFKRVPEAPGTKLLFGMVDYPYPLRLRGFPAGSMWIRVRPDDFVKVRVADGNSVRWFVVCEKEQGVLEPAMEIRPDLRGKMG